jgi:hypothetical protein
LVNFNLISWIKLKINIKTASKSPTQKENKEKKEKFHLIPWVISLILITTLFSYYLIEFYLLEQFQKKDLFDIYDKGTSIVIAIVGVTVTTIFSQLLYAATKQGLETANQLKIIEDNRRKEELTEKFIETRKVPHLQLLEAFDRLLNEINILINSNELEFADILSEGTFVDAIESIRDSYQNNFIVKLYLNEFLLNFYMELKKLEDHNEEIEIEEDINLSEDLKRIGIQERLRALFASPDNDYKENILNKMGVFKLKDRLENARSTLIKEIKDEISIVYGDLLKSEELRIINSQKLSMRYLWTESRFPENDRE